MPYFINRFLYNENISRRVKQFVLISELKKMIVHVQTSVVYLISRTYLQIVRTNQSSRWNEVNLIRVLYMTLLTKVCKFGLKICCLLPNFQTLWKSKSNRIHSYISYISIIYCWITHNHTRPTRHTRFRHTTMIWLLKTVKNFESSSEFWI